MGRFVHLKNLNVKIEQVLVQHLYNNKEITLQGIGSFRLDPSVSLPADTEKEMTIPESAVTFQYNPKATEDESLIDAIVKLTKKIKPLASADLDSFLMLGRQFLNIGKPFILEGLGTLDKAQGGQLEFVPGQFITPKIYAPKALKENENEESSGLFNDYNTVPDNNGKKAFAIIAVIAVLGFLGWAAYHFIFKKVTIPDDKPVTETQQTPAVTDTTAIKKDTLTQSLTSSTVALNNPDNDGYTFRVVFKITNTREAAQASMNKLNSWGHHVIMYTTDSVHYKLAELFKRPLSDTARVRDSLNTFYDAKTIFVETK